jgi:membrane-bound ClpP family serine protease
MTPWWINLALSAHEKTADVVQQTAETAISDTLLAIVLIVVGIVLLLLEFLIVSYGLLAIGALGFAIAGIALGFSASPVVGWVLFTLTPIITAVVVMWGFKRLQRSPLVPKAEINDDAGYRHITEQLGITIGASGILVTDAMPTGRARFQNGEVDVQIIGPAAMKGDAIIVRRIEGPTVMVALHSTSTNSSLNTTTSMNT